MKNYIHVNQHNIKANKKNKNKALPVLTAKNYKENIKTNSLQINGPCKIVYSPDKPLSCGATVWIETESEIIVM